LKRELYGVHPDEIAADFNPGMMHIKSILSQTIVLASIARIVS
jgi:hypothetical protein